MITFEEVSPAKGQYAFQAFLATARAREAQPSGTPLLLRFTEGWSAVLFRRCRDVEKRAARARRSSAALFCGRVAPC
jgi:hypothetical protein